MRSNGYRRRNLARNGWWCLCLLLAGPALAGDHRQGPGVPAEFMTLIEQSMENNTGLTFFLNGQALPAVVTGIGDDDETILGRSQQYDRIVIRLHRVNAIAKQ